MAPDVHVSVAYCLSQGEDQDDLTALLGSSRLAATALSQHPAGAEPPELQNGSEESQSHITL